MTTHPIDLAGPHAAIAEILARWARNAQTEAERATDAADAKRYRAEAERFRKALYQWSSGARVQLAPGDGYLIPSASRGAVHLTTLHSCSCEAGSNGLRCWHRPIVEAIVEAADDWLPASESQLLGDRLAFARRAYWR